MNPSDFLRFGNMPSAFVVDKIGRRRRRADRPRTDDIPTAAEQIAEQVEADSKASVAVATAIATEIDLPPKAKRDHFAVYADARRGRFRGIWGYWIRPICGNNGDRNAHWVRESRTLYLRVNALVTCDACMIIKDKWLEMGGPAATKNRPLTLKRCRDFIRTALPAFWKAGIHP